MPRLLIRPSFRGTNYEVDNYSLNLKSVVILVTTSYHGGCQFSTPNCSRSRLSKDVVVSPVKDSDKHGVKELNISSTCVNAPNLLFYTCMSSHATNPHVTLELFTNTTVISTTPVSSSLSKVESPF